MSRHPDAATVRRCWRALAENAAAAACEVQTPTPGGDVAQERRLKSIIAGGRILRGVRMNPGEGHCASVAAMAFLEVATAWASPSVSDSRRIQLAPLVAAGAGVIETLLDDAAMGLRRPRADIDG